MVSKGSNLSIGADVSVPFTASASDYRPVIGLTTYLEQAKTGVWDVPAAFLPKIYFEAVNLAGGIAVLLPPQPIDTGIANRMLDGLDGLIICGGKDVEAARYGQEAHPENDEPRPDRDALEDELLSAAITRGVPFLGICRGAQILNVNRGGTLIQHLPDVLGTDTYQKGNAVFNTVNVAVTEGSLLADLVGSGEPVAGDMYHHQAIDTLGAGLTVVGKTADDVIEAIQLDGVPFGLAVQWHPEQRLDDIRLFEGLIDAARTYAHLAQSGSTL